MNSKITSITLVRDKLLETDVFPKKNGDRFHTTIATDVIPDILKKEDKCILTLLKDKTYSLSIKLKSGVLNNVENFKQFFDKTYIFDKNKNCFELNTITTYDSLTVSHILIIGTAAKPNAPAAPFEFNGITKTFLIIDNNVDGNTPKYTDVTIEEYLNLYYIEHFSLNIIEFSDLYKKYKNNTEEESGVEPGEQREAAGGVEGAAGEGVKPGEGQVAPGVAGVGAGSQGGGGGTEMTGKKKTVKKIKKTKNKVA